MKEQKYYSCFPQLHSSSDPLSIPAKMSQLLLQQFLEMFQTSPYSTSRSKGSKPAHPLQDASIPEFLCKHSSSTTERKNNVLAAAVVEGFQVTSETPKIKQTFWQIIYEPLENFFGYFFVCVCLCKVLFSLPRGGLSPF